MSLIESSGQQQPVVPVPVDENKSVDKLEIELEEKEQMIKPGGSANDQPAGSTVSDEKVEETKTPRKAKLNIKIPQILRKRSKERPPEKDPNIGKEELNAAPKDAAVKEDVQEVQIPTAEEDKLTGAEESKLDNSVTQNGNLDTSTSSFGPRFSTPKWINFRRVFSFNRSTPGTLGKEPHPEAVVPTSVTLDISEDSVLARTKKLPDDELTKPILFIEPSDKKEAESEEENDKNGLNAEKEVLGNGHPTFLTPFRRLFRRNATNGNAKDVESGEVATELLEKRTTKNGVKEMLEKMTELEPDQKDGLDEAPASPKYGTKGSSDVLGGVIMSGLEKNVKGSNGSEQVTKPRPQLWRERLVGLSRNHKWVLGAVGTILLLLVLLVSIAAFRANKNIDIGSLIYEGKYINTITSCGHIQGVREDGGYVFRGIPYALPPVGELRWRPAKSHSHLNHCWNGTLLATNHSKPCWQYYRSGMYDGSEDCLYLDVYTPKPYYDAPLPVVVFIGGESLNGGQSATLKPSGALARAKNVVFVSVSIRRSVLGFLTVEPLSRNSYPMTSGNYGLSDLLAALTWVRLNAEHFGGDRNHVTLLGHQSGASLVSALLTTHLSKGLFHQVWVSGGSPPSTLISVQEAEAQNAKFLKEVGCSSIECLHNKGPEDLLESVPYDWRASHQDLPTRGETRHHWLVRDGVILRETLQESVDLPQSQLPPDSLLRIPFVAGAPAEVDASLEMFSYLNWNDTNKFSTYLESKLGSFGPSLSREVLDRYFRPESTSWQTYAALLSDVRTICPLYYTTMARADAFSKSPVYFYVAKQRKLTAIGNVADANSDLAAIFGLYNAETREEKKFVKNMEKLFYDFVEKGKLPEGDQDVTKSIYLIDENIQKIFTYPNCDFWLEHGFYPNHTRID